MKHRIEAQLTRLKRMGSTLIAFAIATSFIIYFLPNSEANYWLSKEGKQGFYVLSAFFFFLGFYCLGAIWRRKHFI
ncbi:MAG: hypothetical protein ACH350_06690 [Parachlamydiaceae bacterium]